MYFRSAALTLASIFLNGALCGPARAQTSCAAADVFSRATALLGEKQFDEAAKVLDALNGCSSLSPLQEFQLGWLYGRARKFPVALKIFRQVPADVPDRPTHDYAVGLSQFELSDYEGVIQTFKAAQAVHPLDENASNLMAVAYSKLGRYQDAYGVLAPQIQGRHADLNTYLNLVTVCAEGGDYNNAAKVAGEAAVLFPQSPEPLIARGAANTLLGNMQQAFDDFSQSTHLAPERADARFFLALTKYKEGQYADAVSILNAAIKDGLRDSDLHYLLAECLLKVNGSNKDAALKQLNEAIALNSNSEPPRTLRGKLLLEGGHPDAAIADLEMAVREDPNSRTASYTLARAYRAMGKEADAKRLFQKLRDGPQTTLNEMSDKRLTDILASPGTKVP